MKHTKLGSSDLVVPMCCLGTMTWGEQNTEEEAFEQLDYALAHGVNFIDTAELYPVPPGPKATTTEKFIGNWIASRQCRDKIILATKVMGPAPTGGAEFIQKLRADAAGSYMGVDPTEHPDLTAAQIKLAVNASLKRLQTDYIDLIQLHWPSRSTPKFGGRQYQPGGRAGVPFEESLAAVGELIKEGKVKYWGLSNETSFGVCQMCEAAKRLNVPLPISIQNDFALVTRQFDTELAETCAPNNYNIGLLAYGPLCGGTLAGKYNKEPITAPTPKSRHVLFPGFQPRYHKPAVVAAAEKYTALAKSKGISPATLALAWCASRWYMGSVIIGATTMEQLKENIAAFEVELDEETLKAIDAIHLEARNPSGTD